ncbi:hypothetical protein STXM2123_4103 [Streptomyces sp. F-3]|nr:hypothetical protein STXM2123_4103 [Streptomyces sp. F-3]
MIKLNGSAELTGKEMRPQGAEDILDEDSPSHWTTGRSGTAVPVGVGPPTTALKSRGGPENHFRKSRRRNT